jgi:hypothetical protein
MTCMYLMQPTFRENLNIWILIVFLKKKVVPNLNGCNLVRLRTNSEKMCNIWKIIYTKSYIRFQRLFSQNLASKGKYESRNILDFAKKNEKIWFLFNFFELILLFYFIFNYFKVFILFWDFLLFLIFFSF